MLIEFNISFTLRNIKKHFCFNVLWLLYLLRVILNCYVVFISLWARGTHSFTRLFIFFRIRKWIMKVEIEVLGFVSEENCCKFYSLRISFLFKVNMPVSQDYLSLLYTYTQSSVKTADNVMCDTIFIYYCSLALIYSWYL